MSHQKKPKIISNFKNRLALNGLYEYKSYKAMADISIKTVNILRNLQIMINAITISTKLMAHHLKLAKNTT